MRRTPASRAESLGAMVPADVLKLPNAAPADAWGLRVSHSLLLVC